MLHQVAGLTEGNINTLIQWFVGPVALLIVGWLLDRRGKRRQRLTDAKVDQIPTIVSTALKKTADQLGTKVDETREAVTNGHTQHIRDNLDEEFAQLNTLLQEMFDRIKIVEQRSLRHGRLMTAMGKAVSRMTKDVSALFDRDAELEQDAEEMRASILEIEQTMPREQVRALARSAARARSRPAREPPQPPPEEEPDELQLALDESEQGIQ